VNQAPKGFLAVEGNARVEVTVGQANEPVSAPDIKLSPAASIDIQVVDEQGRPIRDAEIHTVTPHGAGGLSGHQIFSADQDGRAKLEGVDPEDTLPIRVRTKDGASHAAVVVEPREVKQPVQIAASARHAFRPSGTVLDGSGRVIPNAVVALQWHCSLTSRKSSYSGLGISLATYHADAEGNFDIGPFWPGDQYQLTISADGHESRQTSSVSGVAGKTHDFGSIVLRGVQGFVRGQVVDSEGRPVADARVFNSGDAPARLETRSDPQGRFRLEGLRTGRVAIIAEESGRLFAGVRTETGKEDLLIQLSADGGPQGRVANPSDKRQSSEKERQALARWMLERLHSVPAAQRADINFLIIRYMARLDPDTALHWLDESGTARLRQDVLFSIAEARIDADPEEAIALVARPPVRSTAFTPSPTALPRATAKTPCGWRRIWCFAPGKNSRRTKPHLDAYRVPGCSRGSGEGRTGVAGHAGARGRSVSRGGSGVAGRGGACRTPQRRDAFDRRKPGDLYSLAA